MKTNKDKRRFKKKKNREEKNQLSIKIRRDKLRKEAKMNNEISKLQREVEKIQNRGSQIRRVVSSG